MLQSWKRVACTRKAFGIEQQLRLIEWRIRTGEVTAEAVASDHAKWVESLRVQNKIHAFRD